MKRVAQSIVAFIISIFGANAGKVIGIFLISLLPVIELRGSIPVGYYQGLPWYTNMITSIIGNLLPVPFILLFVVKVFEFMKKRNIMVGFIEKIEKRAMSRSDSIANKEFIGLMLFVAIPLPGTGAWTGALIAALLQFNRKKSFMYICIGVLIAASLVTLGVYGVIGSFI
ncbi:putative small multi-drug export protein [Leptotrichia sp. oral taxon 215 str. W9775]|jgi:small multidrug export protein|uniref:COG2426 family protein n=1 Tax=Leptotrichia sp. oral taxon 215 TaxID=712359 RepID=UPI0003AD798B|nr:small multi-drug export protein [Leptotrichia sp. oral taxon 215]ERK68744.1 putative small multi-drug export protein [Leptotrichia sp. oral taxon 215 str. W9775]